MELNLNIYNILVLLGAIHGVFLGVFYLTKKVTYPTTWLLSSLIIVLALANFEFWLYDSRVVVKALHYQFIIPFHLLTLPTFFFFVMSYIGKRKINSIHYIVLFGPFAATVLLKLIYLCSSLITFSFLVTSIRKITDVFLLFSAIYLILIIYHLIKYRKQNNTDNKQIKRNTKWIFSLFFMLLFIFVVWTISVILITKNNFSSRYFALYGVTIITYWIGYTGSLQLKINAERKHLRSDLRNTSTSLKNEKRKTKDDEKLLKDKDYKYKIILDNLMEKELIFTDSTLSLIKLADRLGISSGYLSQLINKIYQKNFSEYLNQYRIDKAKKIIHDANYKNYSLEAIGYEVGYSSKSVFYSNFKKIVGQTPNQYRKANKKV